MKRFLGREWLAQHGWRVGRAVLLGGLLVVAAGSAVWVGARLPSGSAATAPSQTAESGDKPRRVGRDTLEVSVDLVRRLGVMTMPAVAPRARPLPPLPGVLAVDNNRFARVHARFGGEVMELGTIEDPPGLTAGRRPVRYGDEVRHGQLLAVVWSKDLGEKKSELVDALSNQRAAENTLRSLDGAAREGGVPAQSLREAERNVEAARVAVEKAERTLRSWRLTEEEIAAVRAEAESLRKPGASRAQPADWARVEIRAPLDGVILEKNVAAGDIVDTATDLFKVGDLSRLAVWVHVYEEDLPTLLALPRPVRWTISLPSRPGQTFPGTLEQVGSVIDPNQHTALVTGTVANPGGGLKVGQFVTASLELPAPAGQVEVPAD